MEKVTKPTISELDIQKQILTWLKLNGIFAFRVNTMGVPLPNGKFRPSPMKGIPDIIGVLPGGRALFIEVKRPGGKTSKEQDEFLAVADIAGAEVLVAESLEYVIRNLTDKCL